MATNSRPKQRMKEKFRRQMTRLSRARRTVEPYSGIPVKRKRALTSLSTTKRRKVDDVRPATVGTDDMLGTVPPAATPTPSTPDDHALSGRRFTFTAGGSRWKASPRLQDRRWDHKVPSTDAARISIQPHPGQPYFSMLRNASYATCSDTHPFFENAIAEPPNGFDEAGSFVAGLSGTEDGHQIQLEPYDIQSMDIDDADVGEVFFGTEADREGGHGSRSYLARSPTFTNTSHLVSPGNSEEAANIDNTSTTDGEDRSGADSEPINRLDFTPPWDADKINDLDDPEAARVIFGAEVDVEGQRNLSAELNYDTPKRVSCEADDKDITDLDDPGTTDVVFLTKMVTEIGHSLDTRLPSTPLPESDNETPVVSPNHYNAITAGGEGFRGACPETDGGQIINFEDAETEEVFPGTEVDREHGHSQSPYQASSSPSGNSPHLDPTRDDDQATIVAPCLHNTTAVDWEDLRSAHSVQTTGLPYSMPSRGTEQIINLDSSENAEVVGAGVRTRGVYGPSPKPSYNTAKSTPCLDSIPTTGGGYGPGPHSELDDDQIMDLDDERAADVVFGARIDLETGRSLAAGSPRFLSSRNTPHFTPAEYDHEISATTTAERGDGHNVSPQPASYIGHSSSHPTPPRDDDQIMDLEDAETGDIVIWTKEYLDGGCDDRDEPDENVATDVSMDTVSQGKQHRRSRRGTRQRKRTAFGPGLSRWEPSGRNFPSTSQEDTDGMPSPSIFLSPDHSRGISKPVSSVVNSQDDRRRGKDRMSPVPSAGGSEQRLDSAPQVERRSRVSQGAHGGDAPSGDPPVGEPSGRKPHCCVSRDSQAIELNGLLRNLAGILKQVATFNDANYQNIATSLQQVNSKLQESRIGPTEKATSKGSQNHQSRALPLELKRAVRQHSLVLLGRANKQSPVPPPPEPEVIRQFNETGERGPKGQPGKLRLDLQGPIRSSWNRRAARCFRKHFQRCGLYPEWPKSEIETAFLRHTETIRSHYWRDESGMSLRDVERSDRVAKKNRLSTLTEHRRIVCKTHQDMERFAKYIDMLDRGNGMSEDEADWRSSSGKTPTQYLVVCPAWRSKEVSSWLQVIDNVYLARRFKTDGRVTPGNWVRNRIRSGRVSHTAEPVKSLPVNFYDKDWLESLTPRKRRALGASDAIDLTHTNEMIRLSTRYANVKRRSDKPLGG